MLELGRTVLFKKLKICLVHGEQIIVFVKILMTHLARPQLAKVIASRTCCYLRTTIGWLTHMIGVSTCRIDQNGLIQTLLFHYLLKHTMGSRRSTNIAHTNEKNAYFFHTNTLKQVKINKFFILLPIMKKNLMDIGGAFNLTYSD